MQKTNAYIDGFNLYYGALKSERGLKWLDPHRLVCSLMRCQRVQVVKYFTARMIDRPENPNQSQRQDVYLRALETLTHVEVHVGKFQTHTKRVRIAKPGRRHPYANALITEEKSTDVAIGAHLVHDAVTKAINVAVLISNDSDLQVPINMAREVGVRVVLVNPHRHAGQSDHLEGDERRNLTVRHLRKSQLSFTVVADDGSLITRPKEWA